MPILDSINSPADVKALPEQKLPALCTELRTFLVNSVSETGGHLASSLGAVELIVALHRVFNTERDRLIFDVGHQSYVHKILTGRREGFASLRSFGGLAGFPKPDESIHDAFIAGHASNSISAALGMAHARTLSDGNYNVIAVIGDGALTGGLAYEGLSNVGESGEKLIIVLNDNGMSITRNVGGIARYLSRERLKPSYRSFKQRYRNFTGKIPGGAGLYRITHSLKTVVKETILHCSLFEEMGLQYAGPIDGHDIGRIEDALRWARDADGPVVVHILTKKGKGYRYAEERPGDFHGVGKFDPKTGEIPAGKITFSDVFGDELVKLAAEDDKVCAITAAMMTGTGLSEFSKKYPGRFFDVGIAEGHAAVMAAGLACQGMKPVFAVYSSFLQRAYDMILHDVAISHLHVVFGIDRAGIVGEDGETHHGIFDISYLSSVPGVSLYAPSSFAELRFMLRTAVLKTDGPVAIRYPRGGEGLFSAISQGECDCIIKGDDVTIAAYGSMINEAIKASEILRKNGFSAEIIKINRIIPLSLSILFESVKKTGRLIVAEECVASGCIGEKIAADIALCRIPLNKIRLLNLGESFIPHGSIAELRKFCGIDADAIAEAAEEAIHG